MTQQWISVKDEWPIETMDVLWCRAPVDEPYVVASLCDEGFDENYYTHWMLLPAPPGSEPDSGPVSSGTHCTFNDNPDRVEPL